MPVNVGKSISDVPLLNCAISDV